MRAEARRELEGGGGGRKKQRTTTKSKQKRWRERIKQKGEQTDAIQFVLSDKRAFDSLKLEIS